MTGHALRPVIRNSIGLTRATMRIVAADTTEFAFAGLITLAAHHLFNLADGFKRRGACGVSGFIHKPHPHVRQQVAGTKVIVGSVCSQNSVATMQVALIANTVTAHGIQLRRIHNQIFTFASRVKA